MGAVVVEEVSGLQGVGNYFLDMAAKLDEQYEVEELQGAKGLISRH
jgi:ABC-type dipeptide/oligopeptide/nickel transport system permease component